VMTTAGCAEKRLS